MNGYQGKILFVDLTSGSIKEEELPEKVYRDFLGGTGLGAKILYERMKPGADPLGPDNILGFMTGVLTATGAPMSGRTQVVGKSPITGGWGDSNHGGAFAKDLKKAGYDAVFFTGISPKPVYFYLHDGLAAIRDASHLWGKSVVETEEAIQEELGDKLIKVDCIGPAGELKSLSAAIRHEEASSARSGLAAVMGSKRLKAVAVRGTISVPIANIEQFDKLRRESISYIGKTEHPFSPMLKNWGTCSFTSFLIGIGETPIKNWQLYGAEAFPNHGKLDGGEVTKYEIRRCACESCPVACHGYSRVETGPYAIAETIVKPEYEALAMFGSSSMNDDVEAVMKANHLCNIYGLDCISTGNSIAFAMECYDRGLITKADTDGIDLTWGNAEAIVAMVEKIAKRDGFGAVLADGSARAAERIGKGAEKYAMHIGGQDMPAHDPRASVCYGWGYLCDPTPARHTVSMEMFSLEAGVPYSPYDELQFPKFDKFDYKANAPIYVAFNAFHYWLCACGQCAFMFWPHDKYPIAELISAITGWDFTAAEGLKVGRRINTLRQAFNIREGVKTGEWRLPERYVGAPDTGPLAGRDFDWKAMKEGGYAALGWDATTGKPLDSTLQELGLKELVGRLP